ncbi:MAG: hypothetical protein JRJ84_08710 [Deltaproteobacteria bacterium]|nr:hypothetical protein [Deltaproteobacteria bacterium]
MGLFDRLANLARGKAKVWKRQRRGEEAPDAAVEEELEETARKVTPPTTDPSPGPDAETPAPPEEPPVPKKKRL